MNILISTQVSPDDMRSLKVVAKDGGHGLEVLDGGLLGLKNDETAKDGDEYAQRLSSVGSAVQGLMGPPRAS